MDPKELMTETDETLDFRKKVGKVGGGGRGRGRGGGRRREERSGGYKVAWASFSRKGRGRQLGAVG